jgi:hypothetical protein
MYSWHELEDNLTADEEERRGMQPLTTWQTVRAWLLRALELVRKVWHWLHLPVGLAMVALLLPLTNAARCAILHMSGQRTE